MHGPVNSVLERLRNPGLRPSPAAGWQSYCSVRCLCLCMVLSPWWSPPSWCSVRVLGTIYLLRGVLAKRFTSIHSDTPQWQQLTWQSSVEIGSSVSEKSDALLKPCR